MMKFPSLNTIPGAILFGAGAVLIAPLVLPAAASILRSATKFGIKSAMIGYDQGRKMITDARDSIANITSEAKSEVFEPPKKQTKKSAG